MYRTLDRERASFQVTIATSNAIATSNTTVAAETSGMFAALEESDEEEDVSKTEVSSSTVPSQREPSPCCSQSSDATSLEERPTLRLKRYANWCDAESDEENN
jgi:hypothetical protein